MEEYCYNKTVISNVLVIVNIKVVEDNASKKCHHNIEPIIVMHWCENDTHNDDAKCFIVEPYPFA